MKHPPLSPELTVPEVLNASPDAARIFAAHRAACVGCYLARFCTVADVARTYGLAIDRFVAELDQAALADPSYSIGARHEKSD